MPDDTPTPPTSPTSPTPPKAIRRLDSPAATRLVRLVEAYDDLQTVLWCCERLVPALTQAQNGRPEPGPDDVAVEALWSLALLSYARAFSVDGEAAAAVTEQDLAATQADGAVPPAHQVLLHLRDHHASPTTNPREVYTVGLAQDDEGVVNAVAVTSVRAPSVDEAAVRQAGALAYSLCSVLDDRITTVQQSILSEARDTPSTELDAMELIEVAPAG